MHASRFVFALGILALFGQGCLADPPQPNRPILFDFQDAQVEPEGPVPFEPTNIPPAPPAKTGEIKSISGNVVVSSLIPNQELPNPFVVFGRGRVFEGAVLTDALDIGTFGNFRVRAFLRALPEGSTGTVEVFTYSARDGSEQDMVRVPVKFPTGDTALQVFFVNEQADPGLLRCDDPRPVTRRVPYTQNVAEAAILELLRGPTVAEDVYGSRTGIRPGTALRSISITNGTATVDFSREFTQGVAGSCQVQAIRAQVEKTLLQFPTVQHVNMLVEGVSAEPYLQP